MISETIFILVLEIFLGAKNLLGRVEALSVFSIFIPVNSKVINMVNRQRDIRNLLERLDEHRSEVIQDIDSRDYLLEAERVGRKYTTILALMFMTSPILTFISTSTSNYFHDYEEKRLTFRIFIPWSMAEYRFYLAGNILASLIFLAASTMFVAFATLNFTFTYQMKGYLNALQNNFNRKGPKDQSIYKNHQLYIALINDFNDIFSGQIYIDILVSSMMPCGFAYALLQMEKLHESSYMSDWYEEEPKVRRNLLILMTTTVKPAIPNYRFTNNIQFLHDDNKFR
ncbi:hypothetical protein O3M35_007569 [Rhynocoris fuscipes]|uniref:Uncharacterized protein n=1 Tax=Rhynocoris fuscipes TaxID=488301 RepID=A0AAW1DH91_9HEMI